MTKFASQPTGTAYQTISTPQSGAQSHDIADGILDTLESNGLIKEEKVPVYRVQVGLFRNQRYANRLQNELLEQEYPVYIDRSGPYYRVYVGEFDNLNDAVQMERRLKRAGYQALIVQGKI